MFSRRGRFPFLLLLSLGALSVSQHLGAYALNGYHWATGTDITMHLQLTRAPVNFQDGSASWSASAADALTIWNQSLNQVRFVEGPPGIAAGGDGLSSVFFSTTVYGQSWGANVLAVTLYYSQGGNGIFSETDVLFNSAPRWDSYRGPLQHIGSTYTYDFHRVALHEFGHGLGLDHPDEQGQPGIEAQMNSITSDLDHLAADDIAGTEHLYGNTGLKAPTGSEYAYQVRSRISGGSFAANNLPPGLTINPATGLISGIPTISGTYRVTVVVSVPGDSEVLTFMITVAPPASTGAALGTLLGTLSLSVGQLTTDPVRSRVYATLPASNSVAIIDSGSFGVIKTIPVGSNPFGLAVSSDGSKLWVANRNSNSPAISVIDLERLEPLPGISAPQAAFDVEEGLQGRLYVAASASSGSMMQIDSATGVFQGNLGVNYSGPGFLQCSPDRRTLFYAAYGGASLIKFDVSAAAAGLVQNIWASSNGKDLAMTHDGRQIVYFGGGGNPGFPSYSTSKIETSDVNVAFGSFSVGAYPGPATFSGDDTVLYHSTFAQGRVRVFNANTFAEIGAIQLTTVPGSWGPDVNDIALDNTGSVLFFATQNFSGPGELRLYATGRRDQRAPGPPPRPKSLLNVSTRLRSQAGDDVLIGGFIITGSEPKNLALRAIGPSLPVAGRIADPTLELRAANGELVASNDNWNAHRGEVLASGLAPSDEHESTIITRLAPGAYTAILRAIGDTTGVALIEVFDLSAASASRIANLSTRGKVENGDNVMIGGFIIGGDQPTNVIVRAIGPSLDGRGVAGALSDTTLDLHDGNGNRFASNDDWQSDQAAEINAAGLAPGDPRESAIVRTLQPGSYTAIVRGKNNATGVALVEIYNLETN